uniref:(northern house mosquito) hypothetical protein n=1 Tax=Culex pipiens TaxID=7175 RepID=A0A8D8ADH5_CULPI
MFPSIHPPDGWTTLEVVPPWRIPTVLDRKVLRVHRLEGRNERELAIRSAIGHLTLKTTAFDQRLAVSQMVFHVHGRFVALPMVRSDRWITSMTTKDLVPVGNFRVTLQNPPRQL